MSFFWIHLELFFGMYKEPANNNILLFQFIEGSGHYILSDYLGGPDIHLDMGRRLRPKCNESA